MKSLVKLLPLSAAVIAAGTLFAAPHPAEAQRAEPGFNRFNPGYGGVAGVGDYNYYGYGYNDSFRDYNYYRDYSGYYDTDWGVDTWNDWF